MQAYWRGFALFWLLLVVSEVNADVIYEFVGIPTFAREPYTMDMRATARFVISDERMPS